MNDDTLPRHPIRVVAQRTGLTPATIRAWERRYDAVAPGRSEGGQRLYSDHDVDRLRTLRELTSAGRSISLVADLTDEAAEELLTEDRAVSQDLGVGSAGAGPPDWVDETFVQVRELDAGGLERTLWRAVMALGARAFLDEVVVELLARIGSGWVAGEITPGQEHLASEVLDRVLERLADGSRTADGPTLVVTTLPNERHALGARLVSVSAVLEGWDVVYLGVDLPVVDIAATAEALGAAAVAISAVSREDISATQADLVELRELLDPALALLVGGAGAQLFSPSDLPTGVTVLHSLDGLGRYRPPVRGRARQNGGAHTAAGRSGG